MEFGHRAVIISNCVGCISTLHDFFPNGSFPEGVFFHNHDVTCVMLQVFLVAVCI